MILSCIGFPRKNIGVLCMCMIVHGVFTLHLLNDNGILMIKINNTYILWLKGLKISISDSPPLSVIQKLVLELVPSKISLTT
jgi:hypothetical protein